MIYYLEKGLSNLEIAKKVKCTDRYVRKIKGKRSFREHLEERGIEKKDVDFYWDKTKEYSVKVKLNQAQPLTIEQLEKLYLDKLANHVPKYEKLKRIKETHENLLVIDVADAHFGKLSSAYETHEEFNLQIAKERVEEGVSGVLSKAKGFGLDRVLFVIGNDVLHIDSPYAKTTAGTFQNTDGMFYDMFNTAFDVFVDIIEKIAIDYNIDVVFNPSNHDYMLGWTFAQKLQAWFRTAENITFNCDMSHRKYYKYGINMIETDHGDGCKLDQTPLLMAQEQPIMWAETKYRYSYKHHLHHMQYHKFLSGKDYIGVSIEHLRSPSATDSWHHRNGFAGSPKAITGFIHSKTQGQIARLTHYL